MRVMRSAEVDINPHVVPIAEAVDTGMLQEAADDAADEMFSLLPGCRREAAIPRMMSRPDVGLVGFRCLSMVFRSVSEFILMRIRRAAGFRLAISGVDQYEKLVPAASSAHPACARTARLSWR